MAKRVMDISYTINYLIAVYVAVAEDADDGIHRPDLTVESRRTHYER